MLRIEFDSVMTLQMAGRYAETGGWTHTGHAARHNILCVIEEGLCSFCIEDKRWELKAGDAVLIPQGVFYAPTTVDGCRYQYFHFAAKIESVSGPAPMSRSYRHREYMEFEPAALYLPQVFAPGNDVRHGLEQVLAAMSSTEPISSVRMNLAFWDAMSRASARLCERPERTLADEIEHYMHRDPCPTLAAMAEHFGYTRQYIIRVFKKQFHQTPTVYINGLKLSRAVQYLIETDSSIDEIARHCGFEDANYFSRLFKRQYHLSPSEYRKNAMGV